jgi:hypothetical protein
LQLWAEVKQGCGLSALTGAQYLLAHPGGYDLHDGPQTALLGGHQQAGQCTLKRAGGLDSAQGLDGADEGTALGYDAVGGIGDGHLKIPATQFGSSDRVGDRPAYGKLGRQFNLQRVHTFVRHSRIDTTVEDVVADLPASLLQMK